MACFILDVVADLDLSPIERAIFSSRRIERATFEDVAFRVLAAGQHPHFTTVNQFRLQHRAGLASLLRSTLSKADEVDQLEDEHFGKDRAAVDIPEELRRREARLEKIGHRMPGP